MRLVIQRVNSASVSVGEKIVGEIGTGLFVLVGIEQKDTRASVSALAQKLLKLRIMADGNKKMNLSVIEAGGEILVVSQFTLLADTSQGNRPSFLKAANPAKAKELYEFFINTLKSEKLNIQTGSFGEYMQIECELDGPVTILI